MIKNIQKIFQYIKNDSLLYYIFFIPSALVIIYFSLIASNQYITESKFIIRSPQQQSTGSAALGMFLQGTSFARALDDIYSAQEFIESRNAMLRLDSDIGLQEKFSRFNIDPISKFSLFGFKKSNESFYKYYSSKVQLSQDTSSSILTLKTFAFDPETSLEMNKRLLSYSEELVNKLNTRAKNDIVGYSINEYELAKLRAESSRNNIAIYRGENNIVDPERQALIQLQLISKIQDQIVITKTELSQMLAGTPDNPMIENQRKLLISLEREIQNILLNTTGSDESLLSQSPEYSKLLSENLFAEKQLSSSLAALESAKNEAQRQQFYLERIVDPVFTDKSNHPKRLRSILSYMMFLIVLWGISRFALSAIREHSDQ